MTPAERTADLWSRTYVADTEPEAERQADRQFEAFAGHRLLVSEVQAFLRCEDHLDASIGVAGEHCPHLDPYGDPCGAHDITHPDGLLIQVVGANELMGCGWDDDSKGVYPQWDVEIVTTGGLLCDGKPIAPELIDNPWYTPPGIGSAEGFPNAINLIHPEPVT